MGVNMSTLIGWAIVLSGFGYVAHREWAIRQRAQLARAEPQRLRQGRQAAAPQKELKKPKAKETKPKRRAEDPTRGADAKPKAPAAPAAVQAYDYSSDDRDAAINREFARQLNSVKQGTKFTGKTKEETRQKSVKQSRAEEAPVTAVAADTGRASAASSTAGIDADDDSSSAATSPVLAATPASSNNVDDMLEKAAPGPSVLRLTGTEEKPSYKTQKPKAATEPAETKKQRQNRKKAELAKAEREAAEKDRKVKLEAQRRTARQAEGRAAKDGSAFMAAQAQQSNAWTAKTASSASSGTNGSVPVQLLDTFDANVARPEVSKPTVSSYDKNEDWMSSLPSEEEQMELLREEDSWNTVKTKKSKKAKEAAAVEEAPTPVATKAAAAPASTPAAPVAEPAASQKPRPAQIGTQSSFAALAVDNAEEQEEQEWDV